MVCAIDLLQELIEILDLKKSIEHNKFINMLFLITQLINLNLENLKVPQKQEEVLNKIIFFIQSYIHTKLIEITKLYEYETNKKVMKSDILSISYLKSETLNKYKTLYKIEHDVLIQYTKNTYSNIGDIVFVIGWALGGGDRKQELLKNLQSIGDNFGLLYKICRDFDKIESDIKDCNKYNMNFIINDGVQETFILFMETKTQLIEKCLTLNIYTHTLKEVMDELERSVDICLASSNVDLKSNYSSIS
jgi:hypothetical protein